MLDAALYWETRDIYLDLLEQLISGKIDSFEFYVEFRERTYLNSNVLDSLKANSLLLSPHQKSNEFCDFIVEIMGFCI
jgi:hypothetical protein